MLKRAYLQKKGIVSKSYPFFVVICRIMMIVFGVLQCGIVLLVADAYKRTTGAYKAGDYKVVEGWVVNFNSQVRDGEETDFFQISKESFSYSNRDLHQGYHNTKSYGGVITDGRQYLKIGYVPLYGKNIIVYIEELEPELETVPCSKDSLEELFDVIGYDIELGGLSYGLALDVEHCYNVTPVAVAEQTDYKIFKFSDSCISLVLIDGEVYELCNSFGGFGFVSAVPCDFDEDGNIDLLVASSWGSGLHRAEISIFNTKTKESTVLQENFYEDLFVDIRPVSQGSQQMQYLVYAVNIDAENGDLANLVYATVELAGLIEVENGVPVFKSQVD